MVSGCSLFWWQVGVLCFGHKWVFFVCLFLLVASRCFLFCFGGKWVFFVCFGGECSLFACSSGKWMFFVLFWWQVGVLSLFWLQVGVLCFGGKWVFFVCRPYCPDITIMLERALKPSHLSYVPMGNILTGYSGNVPRVEEASCDSCWS